jgi:hypothetical protein
MTVFSQFIHRGPPFYRLGPATGQKLIPALAARAILPSHSPFGGVLEALFAWGLSVPGGLALRKPVPPGVHCGFVRPLPSALTVRGVCWRGQRVPHLGL